MIRYQCRLTVGYLMIIAEELTINLALEKDIKYKASFQFGINYDIIENISLRSGFSNEPSKYSAGIGINYSMFSLDYAMFTHNNLGLTHQAGLIISFGRDENRNISIRKHLGIE